MFMELPPVSLARHLLNPACLPGFLIWGMKGTVGVGKLNNEASLYSPGRSK